ncbi:DUF1499 domain-containing protein [Undibacter mobilis]|uniref:DUF1499 domain-containing protein n=1 Tax=Undibacter mobilis TaxID=2292256 RepID=UPI00143D641C|nr:DUF1499 domain-containing protein [Undibacter mobilis]
MARRLYIEEDLSPWAVWSSRLSLFALAVAGLSALILTTGAFEFGPALATFGAALAFAGVSILFALIAFIAIWRTGGAGLGRALRGLFLSLLLLAYPAYLAQRAFKLPPINDISTDTVNPPRFVALAPQRPPGHVAYPGGQTAQLQRAAYGDIVPLQVDLPPRNTYDVVLTLINKHKWPIAAAQAPTGPRREGTIETTARSLVMGFREDVTIRISPAGNGSRIDLRSASRVSIPDLGTNAARLRSLLEEIDEAVSNAPEPRPEPRPEDQKPAPRRTPKRS